jgi:hypothetical protein
MGSAEAWTRRPSRWLGGWGRGVGWTMSDCMSPHSHVIPPDHVGKRIVQWLSRPQVPGFESWAILFALTRPNSEHVKIVLDLFWLVFLYTAGHHHFAALLARLITAVVVVTPSALLCAPPDGVPGDFQLFASRNHSPHQYSNIVMARSNQPYPYSGSGVRAPSDARES